MSGPRNSSSPAEASAGAMIEKENERLSPLSLTRIMVGETAEQKNLAADLSETQTVLGSDVFNESSLTCEARGAE